MLLLLQAVVQLYSDESEGHHRHDRQVVVDDDTDISVVWREEVVCRHKSGTVGNQLTESQRQR